MNFEDLLKKVIDLLVAKKKLACLVQVEKKDQKVEHLVEKCDSKTYVSFTPNLLIAPLLVPNYHPPNFSATIFVQTSGSDY